MKKITKLIILCVLTFIITIVLFIPTLKNINFGLDLQGGFEILYKVLPLSGKGKVTDEDLKKALEILSALGKAEVVPEKLMDAVVAVSGSSPAYVFMLVEAMADGAVRLGMPRALAYKFAAQTVLGSAKMVLETGKHPGELKDMVCSPAGTTIEAVRVLEASGFRSSLIEAMEACAEISRKL